MIKLTTVEYEVAQIIQNNPRTLKDIREELFRSKFRTNVFHSWIEPIRNLEMYLNPKVFEIDGEIANGDELVTLLKNLTDLEISKYSFKMNYNILAKSSINVQVVSQLEYKILYAVFDNFVSFGALWKTAKSYFADVLEIVNFVEDRPHLFSVFRFSEYESFVMPNMATIKNLDSVKIENKPGSHGYPSLSFDNECKKTVKKSKILFLSTDELTIATMLSKETLLLESLHLKLMCVDESRFKKFKCRSNLKLFLEQRPHLYVKKYGGSFFTITKSCQQFLLQLKEKKLGEKKNNQKSFLCPEEHLIAALLSKDWIGLPGLYRRLKHLDELENFKKFNTTGTTGAIVPLQSFLEERQHLFELKIKPGGHHYTITNFCQNLLVEEKKNFKRTENMANLETSVETGTNEIKEPNSLIIVTEIIEDILIHICGQTIKELDNVIDKKQKISHNYVNDLLPNRIEHNKTVANSKITCLSAEESLIATLLSQDWIGLPGLYRKLKHLDVLENFEKFKTIGATGAIKYECLVPLKCFLEERKHLFELKINPGGHHYTSTNFCQKLVVEEKKNFRSPQNIVANLETSVGKGTNEIKGPNSLIIVTEIIEDILTHICGSTKENSHENNLLPHRIEHNKADDNLKKAFLSAEELKIATLLSQEPLGVEGIFRRLKKHNHNTFKPFTNRPSLKLFLEERPYLFELITRTGKKKGDICQYYVISES